MVELIDAMRLLQAGLKVAVPAATDSAGRPGEWALSATRLYLYSGDGTAHSWTYSTLTVFIAPATVAPQNATSSGSVGALTLSPKTALAPQGATSASPAGSPTLLPNQVLTPQGASSASTAASPVLPLPPTSYSAYALAMDYDSANYNVSGTNYPLITSVPGHAFTRSGAVGFTNLAGGIDNFATGVPAINDRGYHAYGALTNLLANAGSSAVLATQTTAALTAVAHTIAFIGTGSVALSGAFVGSLAGTSATNQVALIFTPTAAALTVTVTGDVRFAGLMAGTLSGAIPIIATGATTAAIGASVLRANDSAASGDQLFIVRAKPVLGSDNKRLAFWGVNDGFADHRVDIYASANRVDAVIGVAAVMTTFIGSTYTAGDTVTAVVRRLGGDWRLGLVINGVLMWTVTQTAGFPTITHVHPGLYPPGSQLQLDSTVEFIGRKLGTFDTDAKVLAAVQETL